ncbi:hypothetical protein PILCRDRAFT_137404 [Piloderma croceum F 1598]|uniref:Uncharacterized protein n=1 Tax=Piloderma croceum (strain F 1598) TaxID=765440 RepID=A0A0C3BYS5_PILCF|nr:hypothetical protein PILCRDRAFT_137404 [Piloderma croceum F 1598]
MSHFLIENDFRNSSLLRVESKTSLATTTPLLPPVAEEDESAYEVGFGASVNVEDNRPPHTPAPSLRRIVGCGDLKKARGSATSIPDSQAAEPNDQAIAANVCASNPSPISLALGSPSGVADSLSTELPPPADVPQGSCHPEASHLIASTNDDHFSGDDSYEATSTPPLSSHHSQESFELDMHVLNLTIQMDQALEEIYDLEAQLHETKALLRKTIADRTDEVEVLLRQIGQMRQDLQNCSQEQRRLERENKVLRDTLHTYNSNGSPYTLRDKYIWPPKPPKPEYDGESAISSTTPTPQLSCGSTSLPPTPLVHKAPSIKAYNPDNELDGLEVDLGDIKQISLLFDDPPSLDAHATDKHPPMLDRDADASPKSPSQIPGCNIERIVH